MEIKSKKNGAPGPPKSTRFILAALLLLAAVSYYIYGYKAGIAFSIGAFALIVILFFHSKLMARRLQSTGHISKALNEIINGSSEKDANYNKLLKSFDKDFRLALGELHANIISLKQDKLRTELILSNMADGITAVDCNGNVTLFNPAAESIFNKKAASLIGLKIEDADLHPEISRLAYECIDRRKILGSEIILPGLPQRVINIRVAPFKAASDGSDCAIVILHDLSDIRRHEKNQKEFVSNVSHELRTPITAIRTNAEALLMGAKSDEELLDKFLNTIITESDRLSTLIEDLLELAKRDAGIVEIKKSERNISDIVEAALETALPQARRSGVEVDVNISQDLAVYIDELQMVRLVRNLADNAVKYTPEGGKVIISAGCDGSNLNISVTDTGIGIPQGEVDRIFNRFYRVDKARSRRLGGTGLGLAIVKDIVDAHGGTISVETQLGKGSTFIVNIPIDKITDKTEEQKQ